MSELHDSSVENAYKRPDRQARIGYGRSRAARRDVFSLAPRDAIAEIEMRIGIFAYACAG
jgi:hypothetical protein